MMNMYIRFLACNNDNMECMANIIQIAIGIKCVRITLYVPYHYR